MLLPTASNNDSGANSNGVSGGAESLAFNSADVEEWLNAHPDFVQDYFLRYATATMFESWRGSSSSSSGGMVGSGVGSSTVGFDGSVGYERSSAVSSGLGSDVFYPLSSSSSTSTTTAASSSTPGPSSTSSNSRASSGANTPVRKISAQEFEKRGQTLKPMVSTVDGVTTFLDAGTSSSPPSGSASTFVPAPRTNRRRRSELKSLDTVELINELVLDICRDLDPTSLGHKILQNVGLLLGADRCSLFLVERRRNWRADVDGGDPRCLVSKLFDVSADTEVSDCNSGEIVVSWGMGIVGHVAMTGTPLNIPDAYADPRFNPEVDQKTKYRTRSILCMPIKDSNDEVIGVAQAINKTSVHDEPFNEHDQKVFQSYLAFCGIGIHNAQMYERLQLENRRNQVLLDLAWAIFEEQTNLANLIHKIMVHTLSLLRCERCQVLLVNEHSKTTFSKVFDLTSNDIDNDDVEVSDGNKEPRFPTNKGITGYVATSGKTLNIPEAYEDDRFDPTVDKDGFRTRSILCMPIKSARNQVIGVAQLVNKLDGMPFNKNDENLFEAFAIFCGMGINNTNVYEQVVKAMARQSVALEVLSYHSAASIEEVQRVKKLTIPSAQHFRLIDFNFNDFSLDDDGTLCATVRMFLDLDLVKKFGIQYDVLLRWMLSVKKNYRAVAYHNWRHAFNVSQTMFVMVSHSERMKGIMGDMERLALVVGSLCHDLDHRGFNNQFQIKTMSPLAQLYSTSTMERHHFDHCMMILNTKGNDILSNLSKEDYKKVVSLLEEAILATDLALYFKHRSEFFKLINSDATDWSIPNHKELLRSMMMTACDLAAISKPWKIQQKVAELIASEFFDQGDIEKNELHLKPMDMMDREKISELPRMQINFIDSICLPIYESFARLGDEFKPLLIGCQENRRNWLALAEGKELEENSTNNAVISKST